MYIQQSDFNRNIHIGQPFPKRLYRKRRPDLPLQVEGRGASILLLGGGAGLLELNLAAGNDVGADALGGSGDGLGDTDAEAVAVLSNKEGQVRLIALALAGLNLRQGAVSGQELGTAVDRGGRGVVGGDDVELIAVGNGYVSVGLGFGIVWCGGETSYSHALGAVGDTGGAERGGLEEDLGVGHGGGGEGEDGGGKLHFNG